MAEAGEMKDLQELLEKAIKHKPTKISLRIKIAQSLETATSEVEISKNGITEATTPFKRRISFTEFGKAVHEAFEKAYGELKVVPISFREELLVNDSVMLRLTPTGSAGIFDITVVYKGEM